MVLSKHKIPLFYDNQGPLKLRGILITVIGITITPNELVAYEECENIAENWGYFRFGISEEAITFTASYAINKKKC